MCQPIFSVVFVYTLEVFEVSCEMKNPEIYKSMVWLMDIQYEMLINSSVLPKIDWRLIRMTKWLMTSHLMLHIYIKKKDINFKETLGCQ